MKDLFRTDRRGCYLAARNSSVLVVRMERVDVIRAARCWSDKDVQGIYAVIILSVW